MRNLIILGTGRSGTSLVTSLFRQAGYYSGDNYIPPRPSNPRGFFEDSEVNRINDDILERLFFTKFLRRLPAFARPRIYSDGRALWLAAPRFVLPRVVPGRIVARMRERLTHSPFCFKDPRFSITLDYWRPFLPPDTAFLVVFRDPEATVHSMLRETREAYAPPIDFHARDAYATWQRSYEKILAAPLKGESWLYVNYEDVLNRSAIPAIAGFAGANVDATIVDPHLSRSSGTRPGTNDKRGRQLCDGIFATLRSNSGRDKHEWACCAPGASELK